MLRLPDELRSAFKEPFGALYTDSERLVADAGTPLVAVGDMVSYHIRRAGRVPDVSVVDGLTEREAVDEAVRRALSDPQSRRDVRNPAAELTEEMAVALREALAATEPVTVVVDGEEDLAALPAVVAAPTGAGVVYGQPGEGMVLVTVTEETKAEMRTLLRRMDGDSEAFLALLDG